MSEITIQSIQYDLEQLFHRTGKVPEAVTISQQDARLFRVGELQIPITHILCWVTGSMLPLQYSKELAAGEVLYSMKEASKAV